MTPEQYRELAERHCFEAGVNCIAWCGPTHPHERKIKKIIAKIVSALKEIKQLKHKDESKGDPK